MFRRHVGAALIRRDSWPDGLLASWLARHPAQRSGLEEDIERALSRHIGAMPFLWLNVPDQADRGFIERNSIALLSCLTGGLDAPSPGWLGHNAERPALPRVPARSAVRQRAGHSSGPHG